MCTVTFLPKGPQSYILTSNRDETPKRAALHPAGYSVFGRQLYFPKEPLAGGTWIVTDKRHFTLCILNGAFEVHKRTPPYRLSRGQMILEFFRYGSVSTFLEEYDFTGIEPFTLVLVDSTASTDLTELVWDGVAAHIQKLDVDQPHIWSSATLYPKEIANQRKAWFRSWLEERTRFDQSEIINFHKYGGRGDLWNNFVMKRGDNLETVSITSIEKANEFAVKYEDLLTKEVSLS